MCKSYHSTGFCPYGTRCHFIHNAEDIEKDSSEEDSLDVKPFEGLKIRYDGKSLWTPPLKHFSAIHSIHPTGHRNLFPETQIQIPIQNLTLQNSKQNLTITWWTTIRHKFRVDQKVDYLERWKVVWQKIRLLLHLIRSDRWKPTPALNRFGRTIILHRWVEISVFRWEEKFAMRCKPYF